MKKHISLSLLVAVAVALQTGTIAASQYLERAKEHAGRGWTGAQQRGTQFMNWLQNNKAAELAGRVRRGEITRQEAAKLLVAAAAGLLTLGAAAVIINRVANRDIIAIAAREFNVDTNNPNNMYLLALFASGEPGPILNLYNTYKTGDVPLTELDASAIQAAAQIADVNRNRAAYEVVQALWKAKATGRFPTPGEMQKMKPLPATPDESARRRQKMKRLPQTPLQQFEATMKY